jgi:hypothetical protein
MLKTEQEISDLVDKLIIADFCSAENREEEILKKTNENARQFLLETDWYVIRFLETAVAIPSDVTIARALARTKVI